FDGQSETDEPAAEEPPVPDPDPEPEPPLDAAPAAEEEPETEALTPMGSKRGVTTSEEIDYRPPPANVLERGKGDRGPDPRDQEATGRKLIETLGHFGVEAKIVGVVSGPHVSLYELRLAP